MGTERFIQSTLFVVQKNIFHIIAIHVERNWCFLGLNLESIFSVGRQTTGYYFAIREAIRFQLSVAVIVGTEMDLSDLLISTL
jgi:hypothetical protein